MPQAYFISDAHLGLGTREEERANLFRKDYKDFSVYAYYMGGLVLVHNRKDSGVSVALYEKGPIAVQIFINERGVVNLDEARSALERVTETNLLSN